MTIGIGGWGSRRKPLSLVRAVVRSGAQDLTIVSFGGPDVGILSATGQATTVIHGFVSLDSVAIDPHFAARREAGTISSIEWDEAMLVAGLRAAARRLPFEVVRSGVGSDAVERDPSLRTIASPYGDGEELLAVPAVPLDLALIHLDRADETGNVQLLGPDLFFDDLFVDAAQTAIVSVEEIVPRGKLATTEALSSIVLTRASVDHLVLAPGGAGFTAHPPYAERDEALQSHYVDAARDPQAWAAFATQFLTVSDEQYRASVTAFARNVAGAQ
ncbi:CoA transferase subunit A [Chryseoglobus sp. KN1116]|uniref:CoA transferase subunit A n=2 Tax=Microcella pacifica TaxID=2591847 RepID=A0A9E5JKQ6_9MICO|nr:CoA transferase subunit A [Microcella pacifica]